MIQAPASAASTEARAPTHPLIESNRIEGTRVYNQQSEHIGTIDHLVIEKVSGRVVYAVMSFGGFLGLGAHLYTVPWEKLHYETSMGGYLSDITETELQEAPYLPHDSHLSREEELRLYKNVARYRV